MPESGTTISGFADKKINKIKIKINADRLTLDWPKP